MDHSGQKKAILQEPVKKILIIKPSSLGDIVHSLPFLDAVKKCFPAADIHWVVARGLHPLLEGHPYIDRLWVINKDRWKRPLYLNHTIREIIDLWKGLRAQKFDVSIDLSGLLRSGLISMASGARVRIGFKESDEGSPFFYTHKVKGSMEIHAIDRYLEIAAFLGCDVSRIHYPFAPYPESPPTSLSLPDNYIVMAPSAGKDANRWPAEKFGQLAARLPLPTMIISSQADAALAAEVENAAQGNAVSLAGRTGLKELIAVIKNASFFISNDTGPMHIAAALEIPVFAIFGPANPVRTGPYGSIHTIISEDLDCAPCYAHQPCKKYDWRCMRDLTVDKVAGIIQKKRGGE